MSHDDEENHEDEDEMMQGEEEYEEELISEDHNAPEDSEERDEETELERYLRSVNGGLTRARTAPIRPMKHAEQFKMTPGFT